MAMNGVIHLALVEAANNRRRRSAVRISLRRLRDASNPFELPDVLFIKIFRLNKYCCRNLIQNLEPHMEEARRLTKIPSFLRVLAALHFFGHGSYQLDVGHGFTFAMSQPSISRSVIEVSEVITNNLLQQWIHFPNTAEEVQQVKGTFQDYGNNFQDCVGIIDCTHIKIIAPAANHPVHPAAPYYCRKGYYSINTQIICDGRKKIININARFPGSVHDSAIWLLSAVKRSLEAKYVAGHTNYLIGDSGYPLEPWLLVPYAEFAQDSPESRFNTALSRLRITIEHVNGILKSRFRCLLSHRTLHYNPIRAAKIIYSCAVLHNMALAYNVPDNEEIIANEPDIQRDVNNHLDNNWFNEGRRIRQNIVNQFFR